MERLNRLFGLSLTLLFLPSITEARLGDAPIQFTDRYGPHQKYNEGTGMHVPFLRGTDNRQYVKGDWIIIAGFPDILSPAIKVRFRKRNFASLTGEEITLILRANCSGMTWRPYTRKHLGEVVLAPVFRMRRWKRDDGATAFLQGNYLELESAELAAHEERMRRHRYEEARKNQPDF